MENVADALRMAFAVLVFVIAMSVTLNLLGQANATTKQIFYSMEEITYIEPANVNTDDANHRIVGIETIIPTIYRYPVEKCGVTIVRKDNNTGKYELIARYDLTTDTVASQITNAMEFNEGGSNTKIEKFKQAALTYYKHMDYLVNNLKVENQLLFPASGNMEISKNDIIKEKYSYNNGLMKRINELYKYYINLRDAEADKNCQYGTVPWSSSIADRLKSDFSSTEPVEMNGQYYDIKKYSSDNNLLSYLRGKKFKEYIIEVTNQENEQLLNNISQSNNSGKLEIIYVEQ